MRELMRLEILAARKATVYGRVLTDLTLADEMKRLAEFHEGRAQSIADLLGETLEDVGGMEDEA